MNRLYLSRLYEPRITLKEHQALNQYIISIFLNSSRSLEVKHSQTVSASLMSTPFKRSAKSSSSSSLSFSSSSRSFNGDDSSSSESINSSFSKSCGWKPASASCIRRNIS
uniref:Uncharacterized protein n=1 Tax=Glossina palpalis gambiensis TaxID=67801 RepID=A0A1B0BNS8_9MUSC